MCGIIGYIGQQSALPLLLEGLKRLEYRGYDSAGALVLDKNHQPICLKTKGEVDLLKNKFHRKPVLGRIGLGHTRWATHGAPSERNAHPHSDCHRKIWLAHNGIIENYRLLKNKLISQGHKFRSETDTEVLAHLIEEAGSDKKSLEDCVREALAQVQGAYGLVVISTDEPDKIIAARNSSPLLIGLGHNELLVASDAAAVITRTKRVIYLYDKEIAVLRQTGFEISTLDDPKSITRKTHQIEWDLGQIEKAGFPHFMLKEIFEQPEAIENSLRGRLISQEGLVKLGGLETVEKKLSHIKRLRIISCGTSYYAGLVAKYMIEEYAGLSVEVELASEFRYRKSRLDKNTAVLAISQSGETADTLAAIQEVKRKGILTLGLINVIGSSIAREVQAGVYNHIGPEISVASTKAFVSQLAILTLLTIFLGRQRAMSLVMGQRLIKELKKIPRQIKEILKQDKLIKKIAKKYFKYDNFIFLGRKYNFPIAQEAALKLKEVSYIHAEGLASGEMKHGPIAMIDKNFPTCFIMPKDSVYEKNVSNLEEIKARGGKIIALTTKNNKELIKLADEIIFIPKTLEMLTPILSIIPWQLLAYQIAVLRQCPIDKPRNLAKSVTVE